MRFQLACLLLALPSMVRAQSEGALRSYFEGRTVRLRIDMPGTQKGVDVYPAAARPVDFPAHAGRLKSYGTAIHRGDEQQVTKIKVKDDLIEFQLGGGGYGTFGDDDSPDVSYAPTPKTTREKNLESDLERATDATAKRRIKEELDGLRRDREREDNRNRAAAAQAEAVRAANIRQRRLDGGSRFNLRFEDTVPPQALDPQWIMTALAEYVDFGTLAAGASAEHPGPPPVEELRKGLSAQEVDAMLGRPVSITERNEGTLVVNVSTYQSDTRSVVAEFVEGVLVRFRITPR